jgi:hypothetical protein
MLRVHNKGTEDVIGYSADDTPRALAMAGGVQAACFNSERRLAVATAAEFVAKPKQLLEQYVHGGHGMGQHFSR